MPPRVVLVGPPGSGKSTAAQLVAQQLGTPSRDTDHDVEHAAGMSVAEVFFERGEEGFRRLERAAVASALDDHDGILALGGGAILDEGTRELLRGLTVVFLDVGIKDAAARIGLNRDRPLLVGNPRAQWIRLMEQRRSIYEEVSVARVDTDGKTPEQVADEVVRLVSRMTAATRVQVHGERPYGVVIGAGVVAEVGALVANAHQVLIVHPHGLAHLVPGIQRDIAAAGAAVVVAPVPDGEAAKTAEVAGDLWSLLGQHAFTRSDALVALGGGATTDLAGFVAATWLRGVRVVHVPTTLLAMVDASIGGKTAIDTAEGKNLVGAFHPPAGVLCDMTLLQSLPRAEMVSGLAEVVKTGFIADERILEIIEADPTAATDPGSDSVRELVERTVRFKAEVVAADPRETGDREVLNYGHTLGHAIERVEGYRWRHGDAVAVGMVYAAELAHELGRLDAASVTRHRSVLASLGLPTSYDGSRWSEVLESMRRDKKARGSTLRFVVLDGIGQPGRLEGPDDALLRRVFERVAS